MEWKFNWDKTEKRWKYEKYWGGKGDGMRNTIIKEERMRRENIIELIKDMIEENMRGFTRI